MSPSHHNSFLQGPQGQRLLHISRALIVGTATWLGCNTVSALPSDQEKPIDINADRVVEDVQQGTTIYSGGVLVQQGTLKIDSETLTLVRGASDGDHFIAVGKPAKFQQQLDDNQEPIVATGERIEYSANDERLVIDGKASILRNGQTFSSPKLEYDLSRNVLVADGNPQGERVTVTLPPRSKQADQSDDDSPQ